VFFLSCLLLKKRDGVTLYLCEFSRKKKDEAICDFTINLHNPIISVKRVGISSFTSSNNSYNVTKKNNKVRWLEQKKDNINLVTRTMEVIIPPGYYSINELLSLIVRLMTEATEAKNKEGTVIAEGRLYTSEEKITFSYSINENYQISILATSSNHTASNKYWGFYSPLKDMKMNLIHSLLGFEMLSQITNAQEITNLNKAEFKQSVTTITDLSLRTLRANHSYSENSSILYLASSVLSNNSIRSMNDEGGLMTSMKTNILETIQINVSRYSHIHFSKFGSDILWHEMDNVSLPHFDMKLLDEHHNINREGVANYRCVIVVETIEPDHKEKELMYKEYNRQAYSMAHRP
jgi:hypothetical protein